MLCIHGSMLSSINMWLNAVHQALIWLNFTQKFASCINMAQKCASCIKSMAHSCTPWLHPRLWCASGISMAQAMHQATIIAHCCASSNNVAVHHASIWLNVLHPWLSDVHQVSVWFNAMYQASIWLSMAQCCASGIIMAQYGSVLCWHQFMARCYMCIRHHNTAQTCINLSQAKLEYQ